MMTLRFTLPTVAMLSLLAGCSHQDRHASGGSGSGGLSTAASAVNGGGMGAGTVSAASVSIAGTGSAGAASASIAGTGSAGATAGASGSGNTIPATFDTVKLVLSGGGGIMPCFAAPCHGVNGMAPPSAPLELPPNNDQKLYANLTTYVSKACGNIKLVDPANPAQSALLKILKGPCGTTPRMPYGCSAEAGDCIPDDYIAAVAQWITAGAPQK